MDLKKKESQDREKEEESFVLTINCRSQLSPLEYGNHCIHQRQ